MYYIFAFLLTTIVLYFRSLKSGGVKSVIAENIMLRQQLLLLRRSHKKSPNLKSSERCLLGLLVALIKPSRVPLNGIIVKPSTILKFLRGLVKLKYKYLFSSKRIYKKPGPKGPSKDVVSAVIDIKKQNPRYGNQRIADVITTTFGFDVDKNIVRRILQKHYRLRSSDEGSLWLSFIGLAKDSLYSLDLFRCESVFLQSYWVLVVMDQYSWQIIGYACNKGSVDALRIRKMTLSILSKNGFPKYICHDNDPLFNSYEWKSLIDIEKRFGCLEDEIFSIPYCPTSHPFIERLIGSTRRECLDQVLILGTKDLEDKLAVYQDYFNNARVHSSLCGQTPSEWKGEHPEVKADISNYKMKSYCRGIFKVPVAA